MKRIARLALAALGVSVALAAASAGVRRSGPELADYGALCAPLDGVDCHRPVLNGGWPLGFLYDVPGGAGTDRLSLGEDELRPLPFLGDVLFYLGMLSISWRYGQARRRRVAGRRPPGRGA